MVPKRPSVAAQKAFMKGFADYDALTAICDKIPHVDQSLIPSSRVCIPNRLYHAMHEFYGRSLALADALETLLEDGEHQLICAEARAKGYRLPDMDDLRHDLESYSEFLQGFDAYNVRPHKNGQVKMAKATAEGHRANLHYSNFMFRRLWQSCFETDYMNYFTDLRRMGVKYAGATALQEMVNILSGFYKAGIANDQFLRQKELRKHFPEFVR